MSRETLDYHWGKHHRTYVDNLNKQIVGTDLDALSLQEVVLLSYNRGNMLPAFNNAAQVNYCFSSFFHSSRFAENWTGPHKVYYIHISNIIGVEIL